MRPPGKQPVYSVPWFPYECSWNVLSVEYDRYKFQVYMRTVLLKLWSRFLMMLKTVGSFSDTEVQARCADQCDLFRYISALMCRREFLLVLLGLVDHVQESCGYQGEEIPLDEKANEQLSYYLFLLKLTLLYTPRAIVTNMSVTREFVFTVSLHVPLHSRQLRWRFSVFRTTVCAFSPSSRVSSRTQSSPLRAQRV